MRNPVAAAASLLLAGFLLAGSFTTADTNAYTVLPEPPKGGYVSYFLGLEKNDDDTELPSFKEGLDYWEATRDQIPLTGEIGKDVLTIARSQVGYTSVKADWDPGQEGIEAYTRYGEWYGWKYSDWCDMFASFCVYYAGLTDYPAECSCMRHELLIKEAGYWRDWNEYIPEIGDLAFVTADKDVHFSSHVGVVEMVLPATETEPARLVLIEGNVKNLWRNKNSVKRRVRYFSEVIGYGTYVKGDPLPGTLSTRLDDVPRLMKVDAEPVWEVLEFIGAADTPYAREKFPEKFVESETGETK